MGEFSLTHILLVAVIFLIFFGPSKLPQLGQSLGKAIRGFKEGLNEIDAEAKDLGKDITHQRLQNPDETPAAKSTAEHSTVAEKKNENV